MLIVEENTSKGFEVYWEVKSIADNGSIEEFTF